MSWHGLCFTLWRAVGDMPNLEVTMQTQSYEAGHLSGYQTAFRTDWTPDPDIFIDIVRSKVKQEMNTVTFFVKIDWLDFWVGVIAGIKACYNDAVFNGANADMI